MGLVATDGKRPETKYVNGFGDVYTNVTDVSLPLELPEDGLYQISAVGYDTNYSRSYNSTVTIDYQNAGEEAPHRVGYGNSDYITGVSGTIAYRKGCKVSVNCKITPSCPSYNLSVAVSKLEV